tara:strand:- start:484 stop:846 length:363 start_codon:yes stop_codon:yes gene_type:complete
MTKKKSLGSITNRDLWTRCGFAEFTSRAKAVAFWNACKKRNLAVEGGQYASEVSGWSFYYVAKLGGNAQQRLDDYTAYIEAACTDEESGFPVTPICGLLAAEERLDHFALWNDFDKRPLN